MRKETFFIVLVYLVFQVSGSLHGIGERTISLGGAAGWESATVKSGLGEVSYIRHYPVLLLSAGAKPAAQPGAAKGGSRFENTAYGTDLSISFDEGKPSFFNDGSGRYRLAVSAELEAVDWRRARAGSGAALFPGTKGNKSGEPLLITVKSNDALFSPGARIGDFSIEFWIYPYTMENGEQVFSWTASRSNGFQRIQCVTEKNRLCWSFLNFFTSPDAAKKLDIRFSGETPVVPKTWTHHLIRFDARTGMVEYAVDGKVEIIEYATASGHESAETYTPLVGESGSFSLGSRYTGLIDEFKLHGVHLNRPTLNKYPASGRMETRTIDLGENSEILKIDARGGRALMQAGSGGANANTKYGEYGINGGTVISSAEYRQGGRFRFDDHSEMQFFLRTAENPYQWDPLAWRAFVPGTELPKNIRGRYVQLAVDFYPSADSLASPYLETLQVNYLPALPPLPPSSLIAVALDGGVQLRWKSSPDIETIGYLVYYGTEKDDYFCEDALPGISPIDAGKQNSLLINGLSNGVLYHFRVAAYDRRSPGKPTLFHVGEFSREVSARPLKGLGDS